MHDDCPEGWSSNGRVVLLTHGLGGCHRSPLLVRLAAKLNERGVRVFRWDMRGCGAGVGLAGRPYHAGCTDDFRRVIASVLNWCSAEVKAAECQLTLFGVSLSGNMVLKYLGESPEAVPSQIVQAISVNPPIELAWCVRTLDGPINRMYDRHFVGSLTRQVAETQRLRPGTPRPATHRQPRRLYEFDDWYTAPMSGFPDAETYYARCSAAQFIPHIQTPTTIITSRNDPMVPVEMFSSDRVNYPETVRLAIASGGGHVGYIARAGLDPDIHWLDWRVVELVTTG